MPIAAAPTSYWPLATAASRPEKSWPVNTSLSYPMRSATSVNSSTSNPVNSPFSSVNVYGFASPMLATRISPGVIRLKGFSVASSGVALPFPLQAARARAAAAATATRHARRELLLNLTVVPILMADAIWLADVPPGGGIPVILCSWLDWESTQFHGEG